MVLLRPIFVLAVLTSACERSADSSPVETPVGVAALVPKVDLSIEGSALYDAAMAPVLADYLVIQRRLAADSRDGIVSAAGRIIAALKHVDPSPVSGAQAEMYRQLPAAATAAATAVRNASDLESAREHFKTLSVIMSAWWKVADPPRVDLYWCSMAPGGWLQQPGDIRNPYYGAAMLECGEKLPN